MSYPRKRVGLLRILFHVILTCLTGGLWLVVLMIHYLLSNS